MRRVKEYVLMEEIGSGAYSKVYKCLNLNDNMLYACKKFDRAMMNPRMIKNLQDEAKVLAKLDSPNILKAHAMIKTKHNFYLVIDHCNGGDLEGLLSAGLKLKEHHVAYIFK